MHFPDRQIMCKCSKIKSFIPSNGCAIVQGVTYNPRWNCQQLKWSVESLIFNIKCPPCYSDYREKITMLHKRKLQPVSKDHMYKEGAALWKDETKIELLLCFLRGKGKLELFNQIPRLILLHLSYDGLPLYSCTFRTCKIILLWSKSHNQYQKLLQILVAISDIQILAAGFSTWSHLEWNITTKAYYT